MAVFVHREPTPRRASARNSGATTQRVRKARSRSRVSPAPATLLPLIELLPLTDP